MPSSSVLLPSCAEKAAERLVIPSSTLTSTMTSPHTRMSPSSFASTLLVWEGTADASPLNDLTLESMT